MGIRDVDKRDLKRWKQRIKDAIPIKSYIKDGALVLQKKDQKTLEELAEEDHVMLVVLDGDTQEVKKAKKDADDLVLRYEDKHCAITSKPIVTDGIQWYFTKPNFLGTMAINKDTLLSGDLYNPSTSTYERRLSKDRFDEAELKRYGIEEEDYTEENGEYVIKQEVVGEVETLHGSKATLKSMNEAKRLRKLLQPSSKDWKTLVMYVGLGAGLMLGIQEYM